MRTRFESLDAFRGICAISVVFFHMHVLGSVTEWDFFRGSSIFVEFFFVLSGFVLAHGYGFKVGLKFKAFVKARFFRIFPLHIIMLLVMIILECGKLLAYKFAGFNFNNAPFTGPGALSEIIPNLLLVQSWTPLTNSQTFNYPSWSISIEFYMYILFFFSISFFKNKKIFAWLSISLVMLYLLAIKSEILNSEVLLGLSCFFGGAYIYFLYKKIEHIKINVLTGSLLELASLISIYSVVSLDFEYRTITAIFAFFITVSIFAFESGVFSKLFKKKYFQIVGRLSYSIYMIHAAFLFCFISIMMVLQKITSLELTLIVDGNRVLNTGNILLNNLLVFIVISLVLLFSNFTYKNIELKGIAMGKRRLFSTSNNPIENFTRI